MKTHLTGFQAKLTACGAVGWSFTTERYQAVTCQRCTKTRNFRQALVRHERESASQGWTGARISATV